MRKVAASVVVGLVAFSCACSRAEKPDIAKARAVMNALLDAERDHRGTNGNYWRGTKSPIDRDDAVRNIGIDFGDAPGFEFAAEPREDGADTTLRITARGTGAASNVSIACVLKASEAKPDCKESGA